MALSVMKHAVDWVRRRVTDSVATQLLGFGGRGLSVVLSFAVTWFIGNRFGPGGSGQYALITQTGMLFSLCVLIGMDFAVSREFARAPAGERRVDRRSVLHLLAFIIASNIVFVVAIGLLPPAWTVERFGLRGGRFELALIGAVMLSRSMGRATAAFLRSQGDHMLGQLVELLAIPLIVLLSIAAFSFRSVDQLLLVTIGAGFVAAAIGIASCLRHTGSGPQQIAISVRRLLAIGFPQWGIAVMLNLVDWYSLAVVSAAAGLADAGVYRVAAQVGSVLTFGITGVTAVMAVQIARAHHAGDNAAIGRLCRRSTRLIMALVVPPTLLLLGLAPQLLSLFGPEFAAGAPVMRILLIAQLIYGLLCSASQVFSIQGRPRLMVMVTLFTTGGFLVLAPLLHRTAGLEGVAIASLLFFLARGLAEFLLVWRTIGINSITGRTRS